MGLGRTELVENPEPWVDRDAEGLMKIPGQEFDITEKAEDVIFRIQ